MSMLFKSEGKPFYPVGGQTHNSSGYSRESMQKAIKALKAINANAIEIPAYWEQVEPKEGEFHFEQIGEIIDEARKNNLKVIFLWFATWKNGCMKYSPVWVKQDPKRFVRVRAHDGVEIPVLSSHCRETLEADKKAFCALLGYIKELDPNAETVIGIQVENEPGILGSDRDYGEEAEAMLKAGVDKELCAALNITHPSTWEETFDMRAGESMTAYSIAKYIDEIVAAGKQVYNLPMIVNVWLGMVTGFRAGLNYPSGGAIKPVMDIWKATAKNIDCIAPDNYIRSKNAYDTINNTYKRADNPLFIPESGIDASNALNMFAGVGCKKAEGYFCFGVESVLDNNGELKAECVPVAESLSCLRNIAPLLQNEELLKNSYAVQQEEFADTMLIDMGKYNAVVDFDSRYCDNPSAENGRGRGLIVKAGEDEFYVVGVGFTVYFSKKIADYEMQTPRNARSFLFSRLQNYISVQEGFFDDNGRFIGRVNRSGDESDFGIWVKNSIGVVRAVLCD